MGTRHNGPMLDAVCFDLMGTVIYDPYVEALEAGMGMSLAKAARFKDPAAWPDFEMGRIDEAEFVRRFYAHEHSGPDFDIEAFHRVRRRGYRFLPGMAELLDELTGVADRYVASNYPVWIEELAVTFDFASRFEAVHASHHFGVRKPDPQFYRSLLDAIGRKAEQCLFIDDRDVNCEAAARVGMAVHRFTDAGGLRARLVAEGLLPRDRG